MGQHDPRARRRRAGGPGDEGGGLRHPQHARQRQPVPLAAARRDRRSLPGRDVPRDHRCHRRGTHLRRLSRRRARHDRPPHLRRPHPARRVPAARARGPTPRADCLRPSACAGFRRSGGPRRAFRGRSGWSTAAWLAAPPNQRLKLPSAAAGNRSFVR